MRIDLCAQVMNVARDTLLVLFIVTSIAYQPLHAEVTFVGNGTVGSDTFAITQNNGTFEAGGTTGDVVVGISAPFASGVFIDGTSPSPGTLISSNVTLGENAGSVGAVDLTDLVSLWDVTDTLRVGSSGSGFIDISNAAAMHADTAIIGDQAGGNGDVNVNGLGSRFIATTLTVGNDGVGTISATGRALIFTDGVASVGTMGSGFGTVILDGIGTNWMSTDAIEIGGAIGSATSTGEIRINNDALVQADSTVTVNGLGIVTLGGGTLRTIPQTTAITNNGVISGDGFIDSALTLSGTGVLSNRAGIANTREHLRVAGAVTNGGTIDSFGGEMTFESAVTNTLELIARDAIVTFNGGLTNSGAGNVVIGGDTTLHAVGGAPLGGIVFTAGKLQVLSDSAATLVGDITFSGSSVLALTIGPDAGTLDVTGVADLSSATFELGYSAGIASQSGDSYQIFQAGGGFGPGFTPTAALADGRTWIIDTLGTSDKLFATALGPTTNPLASDFNGDGIVDALDIAIWSANFGTVGTPPPPILGDADGDGDVNGADFLQIQMDFGMTFPLSSAVAAVPEPSVVLLAALAVGCCSLRRRSF